MITKKVANLKGKFAYFFFKKMGIAKRLFIFFLIIIFIPLVTINIFSFLSTTKYLETTNVKHMMDINRGLFEQIKIEKYKDEQLSDLIMAQSNNLLGRIIYDPGIDASINNSFKTNDMTKLLYGYASNESINRISIINSDGRVYNSFSAPNGKENDSVLKNSLVYKKAKNESKGENIWIPAQEDIYQIFDYKPFIYVARKVFSLDDTNNEIGIEIIQFRYDKIANILKNVFFNKNEYFVLLDNKGTIICNTLDSSEVGMKADKNISSNIKSDMEGYFYSIKENSKYICSYINATNIGWTIVRITPYNSILKMSYETGFLSLSVFIVCLIAAVVFTITFSRNIINPIRKLVEKLKEFGSGKLYVKTVVDREDEIGLLQQNFNLMSDEIRNLVDKNNFENKQRRQLELTILEYQINPHFLYNTLDTIIWMAKKSKQNDISMIVSSLAKFFRIGLSNGREIITIKEEIEHSECFLQIYKIRYNNCFEYRIDLDETLAECTTIKIILQPLVENAIKYGVNKNTGGGVITIHVRKENDAIILEVTDNGKGIDEEILKNVRKSIESDTNDDKFDGGFGLYNVNKRIKMKYGPEYGVSIYSHVGKGTSVQIKIPIVNLLLET